MDMLPEESMESAKITKPSFFKSHLFVYFVFLICFLGIIFFYALSAPSFNRSIANRQPTIVHVADGESLNAVSVDLENKHIIKYHSLLKIFIAVFKLDKQIDRGDYKFDQGMSLPRVAWMLARGDHRTERIKITFKEGITNEEMANLLATSLPSFRRDLFLSDERAKQGYLFPDTYLFFPLTTSSEVLSDISSNFSKHIKLLGQDIQSSGHSLSGNIIMASILEKEAKGKDDAPIIAGILWKRIARGMPLQVDAAKETYGKLGLPSEPIANPGIVSIDASIHSTDSPYLFYLHGKDGTVHFAKTFAEHKKNISLYLK